VKKVVILVAVAGLTVMIVAAGGTRTNSHRVTTPRASSNEAARTKATTAPSTSGVGETTTSQRQRTSLKVLTRATRAEKRTSAFHPAAAIPTAAVTRPGPTTSPTTATATANPAQVAAVLTQALQTCLVLAAVDNARVVAANNAWYQTQLSGLTARHMLASGLYKALQIEQAQTQTLIQAQATIDVSNCYLKFA